MKWTPDAIASATSGEVVRPTNAAGRTDIDGVSIDSRTLDRGQLFVAIAGERDGHAFVKQALEAGAGGALVHDPRSVRADAAVPFIVVDDTSGGLTALGVAARDRLSAHVIGITGSVGKTSTKDMTAAALAAGLETAASEKSFNNELGVPLTLSNSPESAGAVVIEMGSRGIGHIEELCRIARPTVGVVTAVAPAHTELFGGIEEIAAAKSELVRSLDSTGVAVLNSDDDRVAAMAGLTAATVVTYGVTSRGADVLAEHLVIDEELRPSFVVRSPWGTTEVRLEARGSHQVGNALAALAVAGSCDVELEEAAAALAIARLSPWRMEVSRSESGATILNDAYNANPASVSAALRSLAALPASRKQAVLGPMAELGPSAADEHAAIGDLAERLGIRIVAFATPDYGVQSAGDFDEALSALGELGPDDAVLVKASRVVGLERLADLLVKR